MITKIITSSVLSARPVPTLSYVSLPAAELIPDSPPDRHVCAFVLSKTEGPPVIAVGVIAPSRDQALATLVDKVFREAVTRWPEVLGSKRNENAYHAFLADCRQGFLRDPFSPNAVVGLLQMYSDNIAALQKQVGALQEQMAHLQKRVEVLDGFRPAPKGWSWIEDTLWCDDPSAPISDINLGGACVTVHRLDRAWRDDPSAAPRTLYLLTESIRHFLEAGPTFEIWGKEAPKGWCWKERELLYVGERSVSFANSFKWDEKGDVDVGGVIVPAQALRCVLGMA